MLIYIIGALIAFIWVIYKLYTTRNQKPSNNTRIYILFFFLGFLMLCIDYRILKMFMINVPFNEERIWMFRALISVPLVALAINDIPAFFRHTASKIASFKSHLSFPTTFSTNIEKSPKSITRSTLRLFLMMNILIPAVLAGWITVSIYYAYPHYSPLQTTSYELEAVKYIDEKTNKSYIVICDHWTAFAGHMMVGVYNSRAYYFSESEAVGVMLFTKMKDNPSPEVMTEAMNYTNATVTYFIITKEKEYALQTRLGEEEYNSIIQQAQQNNLQTYKVFYYQGEEKLRIFYYRKSPD